MSAEVDAELLRAEAARVSALRLQILDLHPFWGYLLAHLKIVPAPGLCSFAATDCWRHVWYNPARTKVLSLQQLGFVLVHELGHHLLASLDRQQGRNPHLWNCATDYAINRIVARLEHPARPGEALYYSPDGDYPELGKVRILLESRWDGMIAEAIYEYLSAAALPAPTSVLVELEPADGEDGTVLRLPNTTDHGGGLDIHLLVPVFGARAPDDAADILQELPDDLKEQILDAIADEEQEELEELMRYPEDSFALDKELTVAQAIVAIQKNEEAETVFYLYCVNEEGTLVGVLSVRQLLTNNPSAPLNVFFFSWAKILGMGGGEFGLCMKLGGVVWQV